MASLEHSIPFFKGINGEECALFLRAVKLHALEEGRFDDSPWVASFAACHFWGKALRWYLELDHTVRRDWMELQIAMMNEYPMKGDGSTIPSPARAWAAPPSGASDATKQIARIRVLHSSQDLGNELYVSTQTNPESNNILACGGKRNALLVAYSPGLQPYQMQILNPSISGKWLGMKWPGEFDPTCDAYAAVAAIDQGSSQTVEVGEDHARTILWSTVSDGGSLPVLWSGEDGYIYPLQAAIDPGHLQLLLYTNFGIGYSEKVRFQLEAA